MANVQKVSAGGVAGLAIHNERKTKKHSNKDIDISKSHLNYDLCLNDNGSDMVERFSNRMSDEELYCLNRDDVKVMAEWIVTLPKEYLDVNPNLQRQFFEKTYDFLEKEYGRENVLGANVHMDETTPHMHFSFIPVTNKVTENQIKKGYQKKVSAKVVINRQHLQDFHPRLDEYLDKHIEWYRGGILNGETIGIDDINVLKHLTKKYEQSIEENMRDVQVKYFQPVEQAYQVIENLESSRKMLGKRVIDEEIIDEVKDTIKSSQIFLEKMQQQQQELINQTQIAKTQQLANEKEKEELSEYRQSLNHRQEVFKQQIAQEQAELEERETNLDMREYNLDIQIEDERDKYRDEIKDEFQERESNLDKREEMIEQKENELESKSMNLKTQIAFERKAYRDEVDDEFREREQVLSRREHNLNRQIELERDEYRSEVDTEYVSKFNALEERENVLERSERAFKEKVANFEQQVSTFRTSVRDFFIEQFQDFVYEWNYSIQDLFNDLSDKFFDFKDLVKESFEFTQGVDIDTWREERQRQRERDDFER